MSAVPTAYVTKHFNVLLLADTAAIVRAQEELWAGSYEVELVVSDQQGLSCGEPQKVELLACTCDVGDECGAHGSQGQSKKQIKLGPAGIGLLLLGFLMLLRKFADASSDERSHNPSLLLQQTLLMGSFRSFQSRTSVSVRENSKVYPFLKHSQCDL